MYVVKIYEKCRKKWKILTPEFTKKEAEKRWNIYTKNGTVWYKPSHGDYYKVFKTKDNNNIYTNPNVI